MPGLFSESRRGSLPLGIDDRFRAELQGITIPTLIAHGDHDVQAPINICGRKTAQLVPGNTFVEYENAAHGLFVTHPRQLNDDLLAFIEGRMVHAQPGVHTASELKPAASVGA
jgi:pimeloyl-ACP methyl ester carboxylesterase